MTPPPHAPSNRAIHDAVQFDFAGARVLITGGTQGIGKAIADEFLHAGADVVTAARHPATSAGNSPANRFIRADLTDPASIKTLAATVLDTLGGVDVVVNNAGHQTWTPDGILATDDSAWTTDLDTNLMSAVRLDRALLPAMIAAGAGVIIHMTSVQARLPISGCSLPYAAAKAALALYSKGLATDMAPHGIRVNAIAPALIETEGTANFTAVRQHEISRLAPALAARGQPRDIARLVAYLASPAANFITGAHYTVDGGITPTT